MIHAHNLLVYYPELFCSRCCFNHIEAWFKQNGKTKADSNFKSFSFFICLHHEVYFMALYVCVCMCVGVLNATPPCVLRDYRLCRGAAIGEIEM